MPAWQFSQRPIPLAAAIFLGCCLTCLTCSHFCSQQKGKNAWPGSCCIISSQNIVTSRHHSCEVGLEMCSLWDGYMPSWKSIAVARGENKYRGSNQLTRDSIGYLIELFWGLNEIIHAKGIAVADTLSNCGWTFGLFTVWDYFEWSECEQLYMCLLVDVNFSKVVIFPSECVRVSVVPHLPPQLILSSI